MDYKQYIASKLNIDGVSAEEIASFITPTPSQDMGDYALPCFRFAKALRKAPVIIAQDLAAAFETDDTITKVEAVNGYLNFTVNRAGFTLKTLQEVLAKGENFGSSEEGNGKTVCIDYSSINKIGRAHV